MYEQTNNYNNEILDIISKSKNIAIFPSKISGVDSFCAGVGLYYMLRNKEKEAYLVYQGKIPEPCDKLITPTEVTSDMYNKSLLVSIDYANTSASKVSWNTEDGLLNLKIGPVASDFDTSRVKAKIVGLDFDLAIMLGLRELRDLGQTHKELTQEIAGAKIINIDNSNLNTKFGTFNVIDGQANSLSFMVFKQASQWALEPNHKSALALLRGMSHRSL